MSAGPRALLHGQQQAALDLRLQRGHPGERVPGVGVYGRRADLRRGRCDRARRVHMLTPAGWLPVMATVITVRLFATARRWWLRRVALTPLTVQCSLRTREGQYRLLLL